MRKLLLLGVGVCLFLLSSCEKDKDSFEPYPLDGKIANLIDALIDDYSSFTIRPNESQRITIDKNSELSVDAPTFIVSSDEDITLNWLDASNPITMELLELPNFSNGKYLQPIFTFEIDLKQDSKEVEINIDSPIEIRIESEFDENASLFFLSNEGWSSIGNESLIYDEWTDVFGIEKTGYKVIVNNKGWYSISNRVELASQTFSSFCVQLTGQYTQANTKSFVILDNNIVVPMARVMQQGTFCTTMNIPNDQPIRIITMSNLREDKYELFYSEQLMENGLIIAPTMEEKTIDEIKSIIENI